MITAICVIVAVVALFVADLEAYGVVRERYQRRNPAYAPWHKSDAHRRARVPMMGILMYYFPSDEVRP